MNQKETIMASARHTSLMVEILQYRHGKDFKVSLEEIIRAGAEAATTIAIKEEKKNKSNLTDVLGDILREVIEGITSGEKCEECEKKDDCEIKDHLTSSNNDSKKEESIDELIDRKLREMKDKIK